MANAELFTTYAEVKPGVDRLQRPHEHGLLPGRLRLDIATDGVLRFHERRRGATNRRLAKPRSRWAPTSISSGRSWRATTLRLTSQLVDYDHKRLHYIHCMYHAREGYLAATNECLGMYIDLETRRSYQPFSEDADGALPAGTRAGTAVSSIAGVGSQTGNPPQLIAIIAANQSTSGGSDKLTFQYTDPSSLLRPARCLHPPGVRPRCVTSGTNREGPIVFCNRSGIRVGFPVLCPWGVLSFSGTYSVPNIRSQILVTAAKFLSQCWS